MNNKLTMVELADSVAQTLYIPLYMKAQQSRIEKPFFNDELACQLVEQCGYDLSVFNQSLRSSVGCALRAKYFDEQAITFANSRTHPIIVNLGCGLDARYQRIASKIPDSVQFYNLDLPEVMALRERVLPSSAQERPIASSLFHEQWMNQLKIEHPQGDFLFIAEGVLMYFKLDKVKQALTAFAEQFKGCDILFDGTSSWMQKHSDQHDSVQHTGATFQLALDEPKEIEGWAPNLTVLTTKFYTDFEEWKRAGLMNYWLMKRIPRLRKASYLVHLRA